MIDISLNYLLVINLNSNFVNHVKPKESDQVEPFTGNLVHIYAREEFLHLIDSSRP